MIICISQDFTRNVCKKKKKHNADSTLKIKKQNLVHPNPNKCKMFKYKSCNLFTFE